MREWIWRFKAMLNRARLSAERREELEAHIELEIENGLRQGLPPHEARRRARLHAGLVSEGLEASREEFGFRWLDGALADLRHAFRALLRSRGFGVTAVIVLSAGVAINTLIFCVLEGVVLRPLPYPAPRQLVRLYDSGKDVAKFPMALGRFLEYRAHARSLESVALYTGNDMELTAAGGHSQHLTGVRITSDYFTVLGKAPVLGRAFADADLQSGAHNVILSYRLWRDRYHSDPAIAGKTIRLNREPWTIVGVAARGLQHVGGDYRSPLQGETVDLWMPLELAYLSDIELNAAHFCNAVARIREGFTEAQARTELGRLAAEYNTRYPQYGAWTVRVEPLLNEVTGRSREMVWLLAAAGALVMLVACANIAGLCVARAVSRRRELAMRRALGASRWRLIRVGMAENLVMGIAGSMLGLALAAAAFPIMRALLPADFPRAHEISLTPLAALFAAAVAMATAVLAGLVPVGGIGAIETQRVTAGRDSRTLRAALVAGEIALAGLLCAASLLLLRSYREIGGRDHGFDRTGVLTFQLDIPVPDKPKPGQVARLYDGILQNLRAIPGVTAAGATTNLPWSGYDENTGFGIVGRPDSPDMGSRYQGATPGYFEATRMHLLDGRFFDPVQDAFRQPAHLIVNDALARRFFPDGKAVGSSLKLGGNTASIVGVVTGIPDSPSDLQVKPAFWFPLEQSYEPTVYFAVRVRDGVDPASLRRAVTDAVHAADSELALSDIRTLEARTAAALAARRFALLLFQAFAVLALMLAGAGIYALLAYIVEQRSKESGIRVALGATPASLCALVLGDCLKMAAAGGILCAILIPAGGRFIQSFLFNVKALDPITLAAVPAILLLVAMLASLGPARSAMRTDPASALRND